METRPKNVMRFEALAYLALLLTLASAGLNRATIGRHWLEGDFPAKLIYVFGLLLVFGVQVVLIWLIARGRANWARWLGLVLTVGAVPQLVLDAGTRFRADALAATAYYLLFVLWATAITLLFTGDAPAWFKRDASNAPPGDGK